MPANINGIAPTILVDETGAARTLTPLRIVTGAGGVIKATPGKFYGVTAQNVNAAIRYLHLYNKATAPTLSTDTPLISIPLAAAGIRDLILTDHGVIFSVGIAWAFTTDNIAIPATAGTSTELLATAYYA